MSPVRIAACCGVLLWSSVASSNDMFDVPNLTGFLQISLAEFKGAKQQGSGVDAARTGLGRAAIFRGRLQHNAWQLYQGPTLRQAFPTDYRFLNVDTFLARGQKQFPNTWGRQQIESNLIDAANNDIDDVVSQFERLSNMNPDFKNKAPAEMVGDLNQSIQGDPFIGDPAKAANRDLKRIDKYLDQVDSVASAFENRIRAQFPSSAANYKVSEEAKWALYQEAVKQFSARYPPGGPAVPNELLDPVRGEPDPARFVANRGEMRLGFGLVENSRDKSNDTVEGEEDGNEGGVAIAE